MKCLVERILNTPDDVSNIFQEDIFIYPPKVRKRIYSPTVSGGTHPIKMLSTSLRASDCPDAIEPYIRVICNGRCKALLRLIALACKKKRIKDILTYHANSISWTYGQNRP